MRRNHALLTIANLSVAAFLVVAGPSMAVAAADPGGSHGNGGNSNSGKSGSNQGGNSGGGNAGVANSGNGSPGSRGNSAPTSSVSGQTNNGNASKSNGNGSGGGKGGGNGGGNNAAPGAPSNNDGPATPAPLVLPDPPEPVVVADQHVIRTPAGSSWSSPTAAPPAVELRAPLVPREEGAADLLSAAHSDIPVWAAAEPVVLRGDLFGLAGLVLMPLVGLVVGYRQAKAARDVELQIGR